MPALSESKLAEPLYLERGSDLTDRYRMAPSHIRQLFRRYSIYPAKIDRGGGSYRIADVRAK